MKRIIVILSCLVLGVFGLWQINLTVFAVEGGTGSIPNSGANSRFKTSYDWLVAKGANYGVTDAADWTNDYGTWWNRIMEAAAWEPDGTAIEADVTNGTTFYSGNNNRLIKTGTNTISTLLSNQALMDYDDWNCAANNDIATGACVAGDSEYTGEEGTWTLKSNTGTTASVTDNLVTVTIASNKVYQDNWTKLYWSDVNAGGNIIDNEWRRTDDADGQPTCNFNDVGTANEYCDNQDPLAAYAEDNDVSAADFCLNLQLDSNGDSVLETDWRLPSQKELMQAYIDGAANNIPNPGYAFRSSTEDYNSQSYAWLVYLTNGHTTTNTKVTTNAVRCVRRD